MKKVRKGSYGYINSSKIYSSIKTVVFFAISFSILLFGYFKTGSKENVYTVASIVLILPACRSLVNTIMFFRFKSFEKERYDRVKNILCDNEENIAAFYDSILTMEKGGSYMFDFFFSVEGSLIGYTSNQKCDLTLIEKHIKAILKKNCISSVGIKLFNNENSFFTRLNELSNKQSTEKDLDVIALISAISL